MMSWMWSRYFSRSFLQGLQLLNRMSTFKQAIKLTSGRNKVGKRTVQNLQTRVHFRKRHVIKLIKWLTNYFYQKVSCASVCTDVGSVWKYESVKMLLLKLGSELPNLVQKFRSVLKIWTKYSLNNYEKE